MTTIYNTGPIQARQSIGGNNQNNSQQLSITEIAINALSNMVTYISQSIHMAWDKFQADLCNGEKAYRYAKNIEEGKYGQTTADPHIYLKRAADNNHKIACFEYSLYLLNKENQNPEEKAFRYLKVAAREDYEKADSSHTPTVSAAGASTGDEIHIKARYEFAKYVFKNSIDKYFIEAEQSLKKAADLGSTHAAFLYGRRLLVKADGKSEAIKYLNIAVKRGSQEARELLKSLQSQR